ncbi:hypothetical protein [Arthrobacter sp. NEB 688]|uniref:hypothetical protein n=1 Tax=Arthrobacter sp. NEB 688 TaxID=904039 RepID=UPI001566A801|nr:hypothetical protein [Arthrobacter sp. NEB 688]QKE83950.1 hypothetical protein HL663_08355 [Arthrobacter sp. NEB 688]
MPRTRKGSVTLAEQRRPARRGRRVAAVLVLALVGLGVVGWGGVQRLLHAVSGQQCRVTANGTTHDWAPDQASNAAAITAIAVKRGLPPRAASIAIATAMQESKVRNVRFGDRDSLGLFQQRPSQGWGSAEQILDPEYATNKFYDALEKVDGYTSMEIAVAAQEVQRSAAGSAYAQHEDKARTTASVLSGQTAQGIGCALEAPESVGDPDALVALVKKDFGLSATRRDGAVRVRTDSPETAWAVASWAVARAVDTDVTQVSTHGLRWDRSMDDSAFTWSEGSGADDREVVIRLAA